MRINKVIALSIFCVFLSCSEKLIEKPKDVIPKDKMVNILYDLAILNAAMNTNSRVMDEHNIKTMQYVYAKYGIDSIQFARSDVYYASLPATYEAMYSEIVTRLEGDQKKLEELRTKDPDSVATKNKGLKKPAVKQ
jgi:hypothetical protein